MPSHSYLLFVLLFSVSIFADDYWKLKMIQEEKGMVDFVALSKKLNIIVECTSPKMIALTFDDGPEEKTEAILDYLDKRGIPATFFVIGSAVYNFETSRRLLKRMMREGHTIATHSINHADMSWMSEAEILRNFEEPADSVEEMIGIRPRFMRPPYGSYSQAVIDVAKRNGFKVINWNVDSNDWRYSDWDRPSNVLGQVESQEGPHRSSKIVLFHDKHFQKDTLNSIIKFYQNKGYYFVNMEDCLERSPYF